MKKRVLSLLLCGLMLLPLVLASCGLGGNDPDVTTKPEEDTTYAKPATLNFHIVSEKTVSPEDEAAVEAEFNKISKKLYSTQVDFIFYTADEYEEKLLKTLEDAKKIGGISAADKFENSEVVTSLNDVNIPIETYPAIENNQVDIVLINSKELYQSLRGGRHLAEISTLLSSDFKDIEQRVSSHLINGAKEGKSMYAVPNNVLIGQYEFILVHERMAYLANYEQKEDFLINVGGVKTVNYEKLRSFAAYLQEIKTTNDVDDAKVYDDILAALNVDVIYPMEDTRKAQDAPLFEYPTVSFFPKATVDGKDSNGKDNIVYPQTSFGVVYPFYATLGTSIKLNNVFDLTDPNDLNNVSYTEYRKLMLEAKNNGYYPTGPVDNVAYGIRYATGNFVDITKFEEEGYIVLEVDTPRLDSDAAFNAMFAVTNYSASTERSLQIIQALVAGTDEDEVELRNILQYGVKGSHYTKDDDTNEITRKNQNYLMRPEYTGNVVTVYPYKDLKHDLSTKYDVDKMALGYFTEQNKDATLNPLHGMTADLLWKNCRASMVDFYLCHAMADEMIEEFSDRTKYDNKIIDTLMKDTADPDDTVDDKRATLIKGVESAEVQTFYPAANYKEAYMRLYQYWLDVRAGINPLAEKTEATPTAPSDVKRALDAQIGDIEDAAKKAADEYLAEAAVAAEVLWAEAELCDTVEKFDAFLERVAKFKKVSYDATNAVWKYDDGETLSDLDVKIYRYLYLTKTNAEAADSDFYGMLFSGGSQANLYPSTLTDAMAAWYYDYINNR